MLTRWTRLGTAFVVVLVAAVTLPYSFSGDIRYEVGVKEVSGHNAADTFTHRPLLYRLLSAAITAPAQALGSDVGEVEVILRAECAALGLLAGLLLWTGLRHRIKADATPVALVVAAALVLMGPQITLEPDWLAVVSTVLGLGAALALPNRTAAAVVGGTLLAAAAAIKVVTLPIALVGVVVLLLFDRRRALATTVAAAAAGLGFVGAVLIWVPHEIGWLLDMRSVQPTTPPIGVTLGSSLELLGNAATLWPAVALLPAALVGAPHHLRAAALGGAVLAWVPAQVQGQYFIYHLAALPVVTAAVLVLALRRAPATFAVLTLGYTTWVAWVSSTPPSFRSEHLSLLFTVTGVAALGFWVARLRQLPGLRVLGETSADGPDEAAGSGPAVAAVVVASLAASTPFSAASISLQETEQYNPVNRRDNTRTTGAAADRVRTHIGATTPVTYLTFGSYAYFLGNPTDCRYPSPVFLQRGQPRNGLPPTRAWTEALTCITDTPGDWLIWDTNWFKMRRQPAVVHDVIARTFDCENAFEDGPTLACPRRR